MKLQRSDFVLLTETNAFKIIDKEAQLVTFKPNRAQLIVLDKIFEIIDRGELINLAIIKGRQMGITTFLQLVQLALVMSIPSFSAFTLSYNLDSASEIFEKKVKFAFDNLDPAFRDLYKVRTDSARQLKFGDHLQQSSITIGDKARSGTFNMLHISEGGKISQTPTKWQELKAGTLPAAEMGHKIWESTADGGKGSFYQHIMSGAVETLFLGWYLQDEYQAKPPESDGWIEKYDRLAALLELCADPIETHGITKDQWYWYYLKARELQEEVKVQYPFTLAEAFSSKSQTYLKMSFIEEMEVKARTVDVEVMDGVKIYQRPQAGHTYALGSDIATGAGIDFTSIKIYDVYSGLLVASIKGKWDEPTSAHKIVALAKYYNMAYINIELNNTGIAVLRIVKDQYHYPPERIYHIKDTGSERKPTITFGFSTTAKSRPVLLADLKKALYDGDCKIYDIDTIQEFYHFSMINKGQTSRYEAESGFHDDDVMASGVGWQCVLFVRKYAL